MKTAPHLSHLNKQEESELLQMQSVQNSKFYIQNLIIHKALNILSK